MARIALIGCGRHMTSTLVPYLRRLHGHEFIVCIDVDMVKAKLVQGLIGASSCAASTDDLDPHDVDAAIVAVPAPEAYFVVRNLIEKRMACFVEKPPAPSSAMIDDLRIRAEGERVPIQIGFNFRYSDAVRSLQYHVSNLASQPYVAHFEFKSKKPSGSEWERDDPIEAWLYHNGIHVLDLMRWIVGDVAGVEASLYQNPAGRFIIVMLAHHANGSISTLRLGSLTDSFELRAEVMTHVGDQLFMPHLGEVEMAYNAGRISRTILFRTPNLDSAWGRAGYGLELENFLSNYGAFDKCSPTLLDAVRASQLCDKIIDSLRSRAGNLLA